MKAAYITIAMFSGILTISNSAFSAQMRGYPYPVDEYVNDYAGVVKPKDAEGIRKKLRDLESRTGIEAVVVTASSFRDYVTGDTSIESFANGLFDTWGVGNKRENTGILIVLSVRERECRIKMGDGFSGSYNEASKQILDEKMIPCFRQNNFSAGLYEGASGLVEKLSSKWSTLWKYRWQILAAVLFLLLLMSGSFSFSRRRGYYGGYAGGHGISTGRSSFGGGATGRW